MVTCIDVGNSAIKVALVVDGVVGDVNRIATTTPPDTTQLRAALAGSTGPVALVSVVPPWSAGIHALCAELGRDLHQAAVGSIPMPVRIANPERVGADRLLGSWAACELFGAPVIVVDVGTATTIDVVDASGAFAGGAIMPGPSLAIRSLASDTALLPPVPAQLPDRAIGRDTVEAIQAGAVLGHLVAIQGLIALMIAELDGAARPTVVLTGGASPMFGAIDGVDVVDGDLLLRGLGMLAERMAVVR